MSIAASIRQILETGRITVAKSAASTSEGEELTELLREADRRSRQQLPAHWPPLDLDAARYGAETIYRSCQFLVYRDYDAAAVQAGIVIPPPRPNPAEHASVDLVLRFLPDVVRLARAAAPADVLVTRLLELGRRWPLSSVGISGVGDVDVRPLAEHPAVWRHYIDRVIARGDELRLADAQVREAVRESIGAFPELAGALSNAVTSIK